MEKERLILKQKIKDMNDYGYDRIANFNKNYRSGLCETIRELMNSLLINATRLEKKYHKKNTLQDMDIDNTNLKELVRFAFTKKQLAMNQYEYWSKMCVEIGKIIGGMINTNNEVNGAKDSYYVCNCCNVKIKINEYKYSLENFNKALCRRCQNIERERKR